MVFEFTSGIEENLANKLKLAGVIVHGDILPDSSATADDDEDDDSWSSDQSDDESHFEQSRCTNC